VNARFATIVAALLRTATFGDFVAVLAWRYTRHKLQAMVGLPAERLGSGVFLALPGCALERLLKGGAIVYGFAVRDDDSLER
jgi:hypothetical protein